MGFYPFVQNGEIIPELVLAASPEWSWSILAESWFSDEALDVFNEQTSKFRENYKQARAEVDRVYRHKLQEIACAKRRGLPYKRQLNRAIKERLTSRHALWVDRDKFSAPAFVRALEFGYNTERWWTDKYVV